MNAKIIITILVTAILSGGGTYIWQNPDIFSQDQELKSKITELEEKLSSLEAAKEKAKTTKEAESTVVIKTSDWKRFSDSKHGYSVRYPQSWFSLSGAGSATDKYFGTKNVASPLEMEQGDLWVTVRVTDNTKNISLKKFAASPMKGVKLTNEKEVTVGGSSAMYQLEDSSGIEGIEGGYNLSTYVIRNGKTYLIQGLVFEKPSVAKYQAQYDAMVKTFTFKK